MSQSHTSRVASAACDELTSDAAPTRAGREPPRTGFTASITTGSLGTIFAPRSQRWVRLLRRRERVRGTLPFSGASLGGPHYGPDSDSETENPAYSLSGPDAQLLAVLASSSRANPISEAEPPPVTGAGDPSWRDARCGELATVVGALVFTRKYSSAGAKEQYFSAEQRNRNNCSVVESGHRIRTDLDPPLRRALLGSEIVQAAPRATEATSQPTLRTHNKSSLVRESLAMECTGLRARSAIELHLAGRCRFRR